MATICPPQRSSDSFALTAERAMTSSPAALFEAWTHFEQWFAAHECILMRPEVNAPYFFEVHFEDQRHPHYGRFLRLEPARLVEMTWFTSATKNETVVTVELTPAGGGTLLRLTHAGFADEEARDQHQQAWPNVLAHLDEVIR
ncbi:MAG TPA: SRPBCC domain-containing protein [Actinomycetota bacterium]